MYTELPQITTSTAHERLQALQDAKDLMSGSESGGFLATFGGSTKATPGTSSTAIDGFIRLAEYITTGHDYRDTHPEGKRRPVIKHTHVTLVAPGMPEKEDLEHLLHHIENGDFTEFMTDLIKEAEEKQKAEDFEKKFAEDRTEQADSGEPLND